jgi:hypothetical protein
VKTKWRNSALQRWIAVSAVWGMAAAPAFGRSGDTVEESREFEYSVVAFLGRAVTIRLSSPAHIPPAIADRPLPKLLVHPQQRFLTAPWPVAGVYAADTGAISGAPELKRLPGPWTVSFDYN